MAVVGKAPDGVTILQPATKPDHFTRRQIAATIRKVKHWPK
jgi:hypothetical protein